MVNLTISGGRGKMGQALLEASREFEFIKILHLLEDPKHPDVGKVFNGVKVTSSINDCLLTSSCIVEFSTPDATIMHIDFAKKIPKPFVIGTTGLSIPQIEEIKNYSKLAPVLLSSNFSFGVAVLLKVLEKLAVLLKNYEVEIVETHHKEKKDAPSGTALSIAERILKARNLKMDRISKGLRKEGEVGIHSLRGGSVVGEHSVIFFSKGERIEVKHIAENRLTFARGALMASGWIVNKPPGFYSIDDFVSSLG